MIRRPMLNVDSRLAAFVMAKMGGTECGSERAVLAPSAEGVFRALIAAAFDRQCSRCDRIHLCESGSCRNKALERHSEVLHIGRCGGRAVWHDIF
jgi:hypothetical protein